MTPLQKLHKEIRQRAHPKKAKVLARFFKTSQGEYGEGDIFLGLMVPESRTLAKKYKSLPLSDVTKLLKSEIHEIRLIALLMLVHNFKNGSVVVKKRIFDFYLHHTKYINNWDLVDLSAHKIIGAYLLDRPKNSLFKLAKSDNLWERRIAIIATYAFIQQNRFRETLKITSLLLYDKHDLIHKAVGWMLREIGKRSFKTEEDFLKKHYQKMPRMMLRYAIEKFPEKKRKQYLK